MFVYAKSTFKMRSATSRSVKIFLLLFVLITVQFFFQCLLGSAKINSISNIIEMKQWPLLFSIPVLYKNISLKELSNVIKVCGLMSSVIVLLVLLLNLQGTAIRVSIGGTATHALRVTVPTASLITLSFYLYLSSYLRTKSLFDILGLLICFLGTFIQLHRSSTASLVLVTVIFLLMEFRFNISKILLMAVGGVFVLSVVFNAVGYSFDMLLDVFTTSRDAISTGDDAGTSMRFGLISNGLKYVVSNYLIFGIGWDWIPITDTELYNEIQFAQTPTADNGYFNIIIVFGILGLVVFLIMLMRLFISAFKSKKCSLNEGYNIISVGVFYYLMYTILVSMGGDRFLLDSVFPLVIGIVLMNEQCRYLFTRDNQRMIQSSNTIRV